MSTLEDNPLGNDPGSPGLWDILGDLDKVLCIIEVTRRSLGHQAIAGAEYSALGVAFQILRDCHERLDAMATGLEPSNPALEGEQTDEGKQQGEDDSQD